MARLYLLIGLLSLAVFSWAQYRGVGLFDGDASSSRSTRASPSVHGISHK